MTGLKINVKFLEAEFNPTDDDMTAAWDMYVELITRITTQPLADGCGDEKTALESVYSIFAATRSVLKEKGRNANNFSRIAIIVLNQVIRPFTTKWHGEMLKGNLTEEKKAEFRNELEELQLKLKGYSGLLAEMAKVEDLTSIEENTVLND